MVQYWSVPTAFLSWNGYPIIGGYPKQCAMGVNDQSTQAGQVSKHIQNKTGVKRIRGAVGT